MAKNIIKSASERKATETPALIKACDMLEEHDDLAEQRHWHICHIVRLFHLTALHEGRVLLEIINPSLKSQTL